MAITLGTPAYAYRASGSGATISYSVSAFTVPSDATGLLIFVHILTAIVGNPIVTFKQGAGTLVTATLEKTVTGTSNQGQIFIYSVAAPATGTSGTITFNQPSGFSAGYIDASYMEVVAISGGDTTTVVHQVDAKGPGNTAAPSVTTTVDNCVFITTAGTYYNGTAPSYASGPTSSSFWSNTTDNTQFLFVGRSIASQLSGTYTATWTVGFNGCVASLVAVNPGGGGGGGTAQNVSATGIASGETLGTITRSATVILSQTGIATSEAFGAVTASGGTPTLAQTGIASAEAFGAPVLSTSGGGGGASGFSYYRTITIDKTKVAAAQTNFPVLITGTFAYLATVANGGKVQNTSGYDFALYADSAATTLLDFERATWNASTGAVEVWVRIPSLSATVDTTIYLFYGKASQTTDLQNKTGVWDANHVAVFHCNETPSNGSSIADSTSSNNPMVIAPSGSGAGTGTLAKSTGVWAAGNSVRFNQQSEYLGYFAAQASVSGMGSAHSTLECWYQGSVSHAGFDSIENIFGTQPGSYPYKANQLLLTTANKIQFKVGTEGESIVTSGAISTGTWYHLVATFDGSTATIYVNGSLSISSSISRSTTDAALSMANGVEGWFDELRASKVARSSSWVATSYATMTDSAFLAVGSETTTGVTLSATAITSAEAFGTLTLAPGTANKAQTGIASTEAFGTATPAAGNSALAQTGIASAETFGVPTRTGSVSLVQAGIASGETFGTLTVAPGTATRAQTGIASAEALGVPTRTASVTLAQTGIASAETFGTASVGNITAVSPASIASAETFGTLSLAPGTAPVAGTGVASGEAAGVPTFTSAVTLAQTGIASTETFGVPSVGNFTTLNAAPIASAEAFGTLSLTPGSAPVALAGIPSAETFGVPSFAAGNTALLQTGIASSETFGTASANAAITVSATGVASVEAFGSLAIIQSSFLGPTGIASAEAFGSWGIVTSAIVPATALPSSEAFGSLLTTANVRCLLTGIPSGEAVGIAVIERPITLFIAGIPSAETSFGVRIIPSKPKRVITFPNGQVLTSMALTPQAINVTLQTLTCYMLGIDPALDPQAYYKVRLEWPTQGQPAWGISEDICFLKATEEDGDYNKIRDRRLSYQDEATIDSTDTYTRIWRVSWAFYGPNGFDNARQLKSALLSWDFASETLAQMSLYLNTEISATTRSPERFQGQWWERTDLSVRMNELVTESLTVTSIASAEILLIDNDRGQVADITV